MPSLLPQRLFYRSFLLLNPPQSPFLLQPHPCFQALSCSPKISRKCLDLHKGGEAYRWESLPLPATPLYPTLLLSPHHGDDGPAAPKAGLPAGLSHPRSPGHLTPINALCLESLFSPSLLGSLLSAFLNVSVLDFIPFLNQMFQKFFSVVYPLTSTPHFHSQVASTKLSALASRAALI